ncbi:MAG: lipopolysaccharide heptosyltransferase I [Rhodoferax sp.]|nr:lipopolysaccharide heptosyltransferase I [Rhodoferax sp.]MCF8210535.1 lipopolysaccharide heptosyltransferase I [Rhodoferax sp.]
MPVAPKILVVKLSSLGDVVHSMPAVQDMLRALPGARVDWVVERAFAPLVARCVGVGTVIPCDLRTWRKNLWSARTRHEYRVFKTQLQGQSYDAIIDLQGLTKSAWVSWLARTTPRGRRYAMANQTEGSSFEAPTRWVADVAIPLEPHVHAVDRARLLCAQALKYDVPDVQRYGLKPGPNAASPLPSAGALANPFVPRKPFVALVHGTSRADKQWSQDAWIALGQRLNHSGFAVALPHGNATEKMTSEAIAAKLDDAWVWPSMGLDVVIDTLARGAGVIGVDSGLSHIAVALSLPHVQIYNFDTAWRTGPPNTLAHRTHQCSVTATPQPSVETVWQAWESLNTPVLCR